MRPVSSEEAMVRLETQCARAEHCTSEMREKLRRWQITGTEAERIIQSLRKRRFIDDDRFARAYVRDKVMFARWGRRKVQQGLAAKRIDREIIAEALEEIDEGTYAENLRTVLESKIKSAPHLLESYEGRTKIFRYLVGRGYEMSLAAEALRSLMTNDE